MSRAASATHCTYLPTYTHTHTYICQHATAVLGERLHVHRCTGRAGDVFLANYMTAHLIAPNTSPNTRYAMYFRIKSAQEWPHNTAGNGNSQATHCERSMLDPWYVRTCDLRVYVRV